MARSQKVLEQARADLGSLGPTRFAERYREWGWRNGEMAGVMANAGVSAGKVHTVLLPAGARPRPAPTSAPGALPRARAALPRAEAAVGGGERAARQWVARQVQGVKQTATESCEAGKIVFSDRNRPSIAREYRKVHGTPEQRAAEDEAREAAARQGEPAPRSSKERQVEAAGRPGTGTLQWKEAQNAPLARANRDYYNTYHPYFLKGIVSGATAGVSNSVLAPPDPRDTDARAAFDAGVPVGVLLPGAGAERAVGWMGKTALGEVGTAARLATEMASGAAGDATSAYAEGAAKGQPRPERLEAMKAAAASSAATGPLKHAAKEALRTTGAPRPRSPQDPELGPQYDADWLPAKPAAPRVPQDVPRPRPRAALTPPSPGAPGRPAEGRPKVDREASYPAKRRTPHGMHQHDRERARRAHRDH